MISCGLAYSGRGDNGRPEWNRIVNVEILDLEVHSASCIHMMAHWNHTVHLWLKRHVQERVLQPGKKAGLKETMITFTISAIWHGLYPFYYIMFFYCALIVELSKEIFRSRSLFSFIPPVVAHWLANQMTMICLNYLGTAFNLLTFEKGNNFAKTTYYFVFISIFATLFVWKAFGISKIAQKMA